LRRLSQDLERRHRLISEQEEVYASKQMITRYRFGHSLFQDYLYKRLGRGEQRIFHKDVAKALEELHEGQLDEIAVSLAHHYHNADDYDQAFLYYSLAAERAARLFANDEVIAHCTQAIELAVKVSPDVVSLANLHRGRGLALERLGEFDQAHADINTYLQMGREAGECKVEWRALLDLGKLWAYRDYNRTRDLFEEALELSRLMDDPGVLASSLNWMGNWQTNADNSLKAAKYHQEALEIVETLGDKMELANTLDLLGVSHLMGGDLTASVDYYNQAIDLYRKLDDRPRLVSCLTGRAAAVSMLAFLASVSSMPSPDANSDIKKALQISEEIGEITGEAWVYWVQGMIHLVHAEYPLALEFLQRSLQIAINIKHREFVMASRCGLGIVYMDLFDPELAREQLEQAIGLAGELSSSIMTHLATGAYAGACLMQGDHKSARTSLEGVLTPQTGMDTLGKRYCWLRWGELFLSQGDPELALDITDRLIASAPGMSPDRVITLLWKLKGEVLTAMGDAKEAVPLLQAAIKNARELKELFLLWRTQASLGQVYRTLGQGLEAGKEFTTASELVEELADKIPVGELKDNFLGGANEKSRSKK